MLRHLSSIVVGLLVLACGSATAAPLEAYGKLPAIEDVAISPDGATLAVVVTDGEARNILFQDFATGANRKVLRAGDIKVRTCDGQARRS